MSLIGEQTLLRVYLRSADRAPHTPTHERILRAARHEKLAGATVLQGIMGFGTHGLIELATWSIVEHVPIIVEIVDSAENIAAFVRGPLDQIMIGGMLTLERAAVMMYRHRSHEEPGALRLTAALPPLSTTPHIQSGSREGPGALRLAAALPPLSTVPQLQPGAHMTINQSGVLLRVFAGDSDKWAGKPLHQAIIEKVRELGLAGATVLRGSEGFGANSVVHRSHLLAMSTDLPMIVEIVDSEEKINLLLPHLETMVQEGMITMEHVTILMYRHDGGPGKG